MPSIRIQDVCHAANFLRICQLPLQHKRFWFTFTLVFTSIIILTIILKDEIVAVSHPVQKSNYLDSAKPFRHPGQPLVLFYTSWFRRSRWPWNISQTNGDQCSHTCFLTYDKSELADSDAVVFHARDIPSALTLKRIGKLHRNDRQRWVYLNHENPYNSGHKASPYNGIFNWTVTYRRDSDVFYPNGYFREIRSPSEIPEDHLNTNYAKGKDKLVAWMVSHCGRLRDKVVHRLSKFLNISIFGGCSKSFNQAMNQNRCKMDSKECSSLLKTFKFYLAFENEICTDYITEKYWDTPFDHNMVPIVLGSDYHPAVAIPGSFINILDFPSIEALANYIKYLDKNDTAYNEYFQWKTKYQRWSGNSWTCLLCANLHNNSLPKKVYNNFGQYWGIKSSCDKHLAKVLKLIE